MIFLGNLKIDNKNIAEVGLINYELFSNLTEKERLKYEKRGVFVETLPKKEFNSSNEKAKLYIDLKSHELWYEYENIPLTPEELQQEQLNNLGQQLLQTQTELLESKRENELLGQQLFNLQTMLVEKGAM